MTAKATGPATSSPTPAGRPRQGEPPGAAFDAVLNGLQARATDGDASTSGDVTQSGGPGGRVTSTAGDVTQDDSEYSGSHRLSRANATDDRQPPQLPPPTLYAVADALSLPLDAYLAWAYTFWQVQHDRQAEWQSPLWWFAWAARGHPALADLLAQPAYAAEEIENHLAGWTFDLGERGDAPPFGHSPEADWWAEWFGVAGDDARAEFIDVWAKARHLPGRSPLGAAYDATCRRPVPLPPELSATRPVDPSGRSRSDYGFFVALAAHLQLTNGARSVLLPCRELADLLGVSAMTASRYRKFAVADGLLVQSRAHAYVPGAKGRATEFRVDLGRLGLT